MRNWTARRAHCGLGIALSLTIAGLSAAPLYGQAAATGNVVGTVKDDSGGVLPGVSVELSGERVMGLRTSITDERGQYFFRSLPPGLFDLSFTLAGFASEKRSGVRVLVGATIEENVTLRLEGVAESVTVSATAPVVDTKSTKVQTNYDREWIDNSPNQRRSFMDIVTSAPGVEAGDVQTRIQPVSFGSNVDQNLYQLDGVDLTDHFNGNATTMVQPSIDTLEEVEVLSLGAPAEYGSHEGAVFNVVTRQGTNLFRGGAAFYYEHDGLTGRNTTDDVDNGDPFTRIDYNNVTAQLGGPVIQDRLWFFGAYEYLRDAFAVPTVPAEAAGFTDLDHSFVKLNFEVRPGHQLTGLANFDLEQEDFGLFPGENPETAEGTGRDTITTSLAYTGILGANTILEGQYAGFYVDHNCCAAGGGGKVIDTRFENLDTGSASGAIFGWYEYHVDKTSISGKVSHHASDFLKSSHDFKFGVQYSEAPVDGVYGVNDRIYTTDYVTGYGYDYTPYAYGGTVRSLGLFLDDSVQIGERLQLNLGLRFDNTHAGFSDQPVLDAEGNPTSAVMQGYDVYTWNTLAPRLGFNLDLTGDGKTVLKAHYGRYYRAGNTGEWVAATSPTRVQSFFGDWNFETDSFENLVLNGSPANASVDPGFDPARTDQFIVSLEREIVQNFGVSATYIGKRGRRLSNWTDVGGIYAPVPYVDDVGAEASGETITVFQLQNSRADREFVLQTGEETRSDNDAFSLTATKRMSSDWQLTTSLTLQDPTSFRVFGETAQLNFREYGRDPNDYVNSEGLAVRNRDVLAKAQFLYAGLPWDFLLGVDWNYYTGYPERRQVLVDETGLLSRVQTRPRTDDERFESVNLFNLRIQKDVPLGWKDSRVSLIGNFFNLFNDGAVTRYRTDLATSDIYHTPSQVLLPRRLMLAVKFDF
jgi:outer membrane receptor protein involved in Fe transport